MYLVALKMLFFERAKYLGLVFGIMFATNLMSQQVSMFMGIMARTASQIRDVSEADIWVMNPQVRYVDENRPMPDRDLLRVRGVEGVAWAVPFLKGVATARTQEGKMQQVLVLGVDDTSLIGQPPKMLLGRWEDLKKPDAMIMDRAGFAFIWPGEPFEKGRVIEMNDHRVVIEGICEVSATFSTTPLVFTRLSQAKKLSPGERNRMSFILAKAQEGESTRGVARAIQQRTGLKALSSQDFQWQSIMYYLKRTAIPINFGITVALGFIIGAVVSGQTFYIFVIENLRYFGVLKALGVTSGQILRMVLLQAAVVAMIGYGLGMGLCALFFALTGHTPSLRGFGLYGEVALGTGCAVVLIMIIASMMSVRKALVVDPAMVFRG